MSIVPYEPERPIIYDMGFPPTDPNSPWVMQDPGTPPPIPDYDLNINPFLQLLGINANIPAIHISAPKDVVMSATQQKRVRKQYPALTNLFGLKHQSNFMSMAEDGGDGGDGGDTGGSDEPVYPDEDGTIHGGVEYPDYPDYPYPSDDGGDEGYPGEPPEEPDRRTRQAYNPYQFSALVQSIVDQTLDAAISSAQQAQSYSNAGNTSSHNYRNSVKQLNTSVKAINETHNIQQSYLSKLLDQVTNANNQEQYSRLLNQYTQQKEQALATQNLANRLDYALQNKDYGNVAYEAQNYSIPDMPSNNTYTPINSDWQDSTNYKLQASLDQSFGNSNNEPANQSYYQPQTQNYPNYPMPNYNMPNPNSGSNNNFPRFNLAVSKDVQLEPSQSVNPVTVTNPNATVNPETLAETGKVMSASATVAEFMDNLNKIPEIDSKVIKQAFATYQGPTGQQIQADFQKTLQAGIEKITQECVKGAQAFKLATEISSKVASIFAAAYIVQQFIQGFQKGGISDSAVRGGVALAESAIATAIFGILLTANLPVLAPASITLIASLLIDYAFEQLLDYLKL